MKAFIFDLDGVLVSTDKYHYQAWKKMADDEGIYFDEKINDRLRGVSRMASLGIVLERARRQYTEEEKVALANKKNDLYRDLLKNLTPADRLAGVTETLEKLKEKGGNYEARYSNDESPGVDNLNFNSTNPKILTYHSAKGLQFETVFIPYLESADMSKRKALYVAMTRTYRDLYMMYSGKLPQLFSELDRTLYTTTEVEEIEDL